MIIIKQVEENKNYWINKEQINEHCNELSLSYTRRIQLICIRTLLQNQRFT